MAPENMHSFWNNTISNVYGSFCAGLSGMQKYCELGEVTFLGRKLPNYKSEIQQRLYLLRYFSAYLFEYVEAFSLLAKSGFITKPAKIVSLGSGSGIDGMAARFALPACSYLGIDLVKWSDWFPHESPQIMNAAEFIPAAQDVFVFPKSLNEFSDDVVLALADNLPKTSASKICIINSRRSDTATDGEKCTKLLQAFGSTHDNTTCLKVHPNGMRFNAYYNWFFYPPHILNSVAGLSALCPNSIDSWPNNCIYGNEWCDHSAMNKSPILWDKFFCTQIYLIQR